MKGMYLGDLCAETGHFWWARKIWLFTAGLIEDKDYADWRYVGFNTQRVRLRDVISETECELLYRRCSDLWRNLGFPEYAWWDKRMEHFASNYFGTCYYDLFLDKYESYYEYSNEEYEAEMEGYRKDQETELLFRDALPDNLPPCSQDFIDYWHDGPHMEDFSWLDD